MRRVKFTHKFVKQIPEILADGVIFVSLEHSIVVHLCACGCRNEVVTPIAKNGWKFLFDGEAISLQPSIGNWNFPCRSHYWVIDDVVIWASEAYVKNNPTTENHKEKSRSLTSGLLVLWRKVQRWIRH